MGPVDVACGNVYFQTLLSCQLRRPAYTAVVRGHSHDTGNEDVYKRQELEDICDHVGLLHKGGILLSKDLDDMKLNIHKIQCVLKPDMKPEDLTSLDKVNVEQRGSLCTITARGSRGEVEAVMASYEPVFFECCLLYTSE